MRATEIHFTHRVGWLRAAVLGANDGIVSTASLIVGVAAAEASRSSVLVAGVAGLVAGAMSMAAGEYVSVSSQSDTERADLDREQAELATDGENEHAELAAIYVARGLDAGLASQVATQLMAKDALGAHARDELGISDTLSARPVQAAFASAGSFTVGAVLPLLLVLIVPRSALAWTVSGGSLLFLAHFRRASRSEWKDGRFMCVWQYTVAMDEDCAFAIRRLVDRALRARSRGINDTTTAVVCVDYLTVTLAGLVSREIPLSRCYHNGELRMIFIVHT